MPPFAPGFPGRPFHSRLQASLHPERSHARLEIEAELDGPNAGWTDLTRDWLRDPAATIEYGITGAGPLDLVASTGRLSFTLDNGPDNSGLLLGYYSPGHSNCRPGFKLGIAVRLRYLLNGVTYYKFRGWLDMIEPMAGRYRDGKTLCVAVDFMDVAAGSNPVVATQTNKRADEVLNAIVPAIVRQPAGTDYDVGDSTFLYALDNSQNESQTAMSEFQRIAESEYGRIYVKGNTTTGGVLTFEKRTARFGAAVPVATFSDSMLKLTSPQDRSQIKNRVKATVHPRRVDAAATTVLYTLPTTGNVQSVPVGATVKITGSYADPSNLGTRVGGTDMVTPVATTDYTMNTLATGAGSDLTSSFTVTAFYGANSVEYTITNSSASVGYITKLQARGRGIYDYDAIDTVAVDDASIFSYGENRVTLDMPYQHDAGVAGQVGTYILAAWANPTANDVTLGYLAKDDTGLAVALPIEVGDSIAVTETATGINSYYYVNSVSMRFVTDQIIYFEWGLQRAVSLPVVQSKTSSVVSSDQTAHTVNMPSGIVAGDLLISVFTTDSIPTVTWPAGWTRFAEQQSFNLTGTQSVAYRLADGTEGASISVTTSTAEQSTHVTYRIVGAADPSTQPPQAVTYTASPSNSYDCPSITPAGGSKYYLWLATCGINRWLFSLTAVPPNYANTEYLPGVGNRWATAVADRSSRAASEDPGAFVIDYSHPPYPGFITMTIAVHPAF